MLIILNLEMKEDEAASMIRMANTDKDLFFLIGKYEIIKHTNRLLEIKPK